MSAKLSWQGIITAVQPRARVWRYKTDNRTHTLLGFNVWLDGELVGESTSFVVAISGMQQRKAQLAVGDVASGTGWNVQDPKREVADLYRAGDLKVVSRSAAPPTTEPPYVGVTPDTTTYAQRGARMLDERRWRTACMTCRWANKSAVEIEFEFGKTRRRRFETFCYGPKSCALYDPGKPRPVPYKGNSPSMDNGVLDDCLTSGRGDDE